MDNNSKTFATSFTFAVVPSLIAGVVAIAPMPGQHHVTATSYVTACSLPSYDHADPVHSDSSFEFIRIANPESGTASTMRITAIPR